MKRLFIWLLWVIVIAGAGVGVDQLLMNFNTSSPIYQEAQIFYQDFRGRVVKLGKKEEYRLEAVKKKWPPTLLPAGQEKIKPLLRSEPEPSGYVYSDKAGGLHLTTSLDEVPKEYRAAAKPLQK